MKTLSKILNRDLMGTVTEVNPFTGERMTAVPALLAILGFAICAIGMALIAISPV